MKYIILSLFVGVVGMAIATPVSAQTYYNGYNNNQPYAYNQQYSYQQAAANRIPEFLSAPVTTATVGSGYEYGVRAQDPDGNSTTYMLTQAPSGMVMNTVTHVISWTPKSAGSYPVTVSVFDYTNQPAVQNFTVTVKAIAAAPVAQASQSTGEASFFGSSKSKALAINDIKVTSGPRNINNQVSNANCGVSISWTTTQDTVGQVVYGTHSQPDASSFQYEQAVGEGSSPQVAHSVALPSCISGDAVNHFRILVYGSNGSGYLASAEQTILPLPVEVAGGAPATASVLETSSGSFIGTVGNFLTNPFVIVLIVALVAFLVVRKYRNRESNSASDSHGGHGEATLDEPVIAIPHH